MLLFILLFFINADDSIMSMSVDEYTDAVKSLAKKLNTNITWKVKEDISKYVASIDGQSFDSTIHSVQGIITKDIYIFWTVGLETSADVQEKQDEIVQWVHDLPKNHEDILQKTIQFVVPNDDVKTALKAIFQDAELDVSE